MASPSTRSGKNSKRQRVPTSLLLRFAGLAIGVGILLSGVVYASDGFAQFLIRNPRFFLPGPPDYGLESPNLELHGIRYAPRQRVLRLFEPDYGRSLYLFPLAERRKELLRVPWVHDASITRIWPNRIVVQISERKPAAFIKLPAESMLRWALIDDEGVILDAPKKSSFQLPVLDGVMGGETQAKRGVRVRRMERLMTDLGPLASGVSEVDASDLDDMKITEQAGGVAVTLMLGDRNFKSRLRNFLAHYSEIHKSMPRAGMFDLRLDDRITALEARRDVR